MHNLSKNFRFDRFIPFRDSNHLNMIEYVMMHKDSPPDWLTETFEIDPSSTFDEKE